MIGSAMQPELVMPAWGIFAIVLVKSVAPLIRARRNGRNGHAGCGDTPELRQLARRLGDQFSQDPPRRHTELLIEIRDGMRTVGVQIGKLTEQLQRNGRA